MNLHVIKLHRTHTHIHTCAHVYEGLHIILMSVSWF